MFCIKIIYLLKITKCYVQLKEFKFDLLIFNSDRLHVSYYFLFK